MIRDPRLTKNTPGQTSGELALLVKVARMYHHQQMRQAAIAAELHMSQSRVSRMLSEAVRAGIVRTTVIAPTELHPELEEELTARYELRDMVVVDADHQDPSVIQHELGAVAARYLEATLTGQDRVGISSWSATLLAMVESMEQSRLSLASDIVQLIGGVGRPEVQVNATRLAELLARKTRAEAHFLSAPGVLPSVEVRDALMQDDFMVEMARRWAELDVALVGIGGREPSPLLVQSGNVAPGTETEGFRAQGAVGDVVLRMIDADGRLVPSSFDDRVLGIPVDLYMKIERRLGIAAGENKFEAIRAALRGRWINILITDLATAEGLAAAP
ncbi:MAG: sugar-binding transcriptional regulator [Propioniciclava sp.]